jgi:aspartate racemase
MKTPSTIGIIGGMSPESTHVYYRHIVRRHEEVFGDHSYPRMVITSVSFQEYIDWQHSGDWQRIAEGLEREFHAVAAAGAAFGVLATNTMHKVLPDVKSPIPVLNVMDAVARHFKVQGVRRLALTGTRFTMSDGFYQKGLERRGVGVIIPDGAEQTALHRTIYDELILGKATRESRARFAALTARLAGTGAEVMLLACTELGLLCDGLALPLPTMDTAIIHAEAAWQVATGRASLDSFR